MLPSFPFMPCYLGMRHLLKLDIFLTSVRQSWTVHEGAAIRTLGKQVNSNKTQRCECFVHGQTFVFLLDVWNNWISTEQFYYRWTKSLKNATVGFFFTTSAVKPESHQFVYTVLLNIELFDLLVFWIHVY